MTNYKNEYKMKRTTIHKILISMIVMAVSSSLMAISMPSGINNEPMLPERQYLPGEVRDTAALFADTLQSRTYESKINVIARSYGDSIVLRWAAEDFPSWQYLNHVGVDIYRYPIDLKKNEEYTIDTLVHAFKPAPLVRWRAKYPETDSVAYIAMGTLYGAGGFTQEQSNHPVGDIGAMLDVYDDQQMQFGMAVLTSEWRRDIAEMLAMRFVDRNVSAGRKYMYIVRPTEFDSTHNIIFRAGHIEEIENLKYTPETFETEMRDSLVNINLLRLWWTNNENYSSYEIERRRKGESEWTRINEHTYLSMRDVKDDNLDNSISDNVPSPGIYEYRILAHDAFGDLLVSSTIHTASVADIDAPRPANLKYVVINRTNPKDLSADIFAEFHFEKDTIEDDFIGCKILYYQKESGDSIAKWKELTKNYIPIGDTTCIINVTGLSTSQMIVAAYDTAQNVSYSIPQIVRITDVTAPTAPANFRYEIVNNQEGTVKLMWDTPTDDVDYYEIAYANDTTHQFTQRQIEGELLRNNEWIDTLATDVNQKYIYYKVRAVDYATNVGQYTKPLQVLRPSTIVPGVAHIDSAWVDQTKGISMRWACSNEAQISHHKLMRRLEKSNKDWEVIRVFDGDSLRNVGHIIEITDVPEYVRRKRYEYAIETFTYSGISSGLSLIYSARFEGKPVFEWDIKLLGRYDETEKKTKLAWEMNKQLPYKGNWYFCVYRKGENDKRHKFLISVKSNLYGFEDYLLAEGKSAEYYIIIQYEDGRVSTPSNIITISRPKKQ